MVGSVQWCGGEGRRLATPCICNMVISGVLGQMEGIGGSRREYRGSFFTLLVDCLSISATDLGAAFPVAAWQRSAFTSRRLRTWPQ